MASRRWARTAWMADSSVTGEGWSCVGLLVRWLVGCGKGGGWGVFGGLGGKRKGMGKGVGGGVKGEVDKI